MSDGRENYLAGMEHEGGSDPSVEAAEIEAEHLEAEDEDQINPDDTNQDISDAVAAKAIDDQNWRQKIGSKFTKGVGGVLSHLWKNKVAVGAYTIIPSAIGIGIAEGISATTGADIPREINYPLMVAASYPLTAGLRFVFTEATIVWAGTKDGLSRTETVNNSKFLQSIFGHRRRFSDISDTKAGRNNGTYLGAALAASMALFGSQYLDAAKSMTLGFPDTVRATFNASERAFWPNPVEVVEPEGYEGKEIQAYTQDQLPEGATLYLQFNQEPAAEELTPEDINPAAGESFDEIIDEHEESVIPAEEVEILPQRVNKPAPGPR